MEQFEQLLTCAICLDRYRNPKLLPCQHSFCMEPCMDGLVDYVRRQVKCPECRAEHRIPYQGVQGYPTNVTLQRFLELHIEITGELPDPTSGQIMERCNVCSEKAYCTICVHCDKKICPDCKGAHMDILRREIARINNQVRRALHRLEDLQAVVEKNMLSLQTNCSSVTEEVDEIYRRLSKALKDRTEFLRGEIDRYMTTEIKNLSTLKINLEQEISNIQSNCDLADKHMNDDVEWDDCELMDTKEIFLKTVDFIRNFEYEATDYNRRVRFAMAHDPNQLVLHVAGYGELTINMPHQFNQGVVGSSSSANLLQPPGPATGLARSKSDHRLATQFRQQEERGGGYERGYEDDQPRKFGERQRQSQGYGDRYARQDYTSEFESPYDNEPRSGRSGYRSRFRRDRDNDSDNDSSQTRSVRFTEPQQKERERVLDTEDVARGPLSGITRLYDSPRVMKRISEIGKEKKKPEPKPEPPIPKFQPPPKKAQRQISEEDEITRIKKQNKQSDTPPVDRVQALKRTTSAESEERSSPTSQRDERKTPPVAEVPSSEAESEEDEEEETPSALQKVLNKTATAANTANNARRDSVTNDATKKSGRSASSDSTSSSESSHTSAVKNTGAAYTTEEVKQKILSKGAGDKTEVGSGGSGTSTPHGRRSSAGSDTTKNETPVTPAAPPKFQSRFLNQVRQNNAEKAKVTKEEEEETESTSESETDSDEESDDDKNKSESKTMDKTDIGPLLARSAQARDTSSFSSRRDSRDEATTGYKSRYGQQDSPSSYKSPYAAKEEPPSPRSRYGTTPQEETTPPRNRYGLNKEEDSTPGSRYLNRNRATAATQPEEEPKYGGYKSRFLNKSKSTATVSPDEDSDRNSSKKYPSSGIDDESKYPSGRSRYTALKDRKNRIARSRSSHNFGNAEDDEEDDTNSPTAYMQSKYGPASGNDLSRSRSTHHLKSRENSPDRLGPGSEKDGAALSSWARYLKNKYGTRGKDGKDSTANSSAGASAASSSSASRRLSLGLPLRHNTSIESSDDDQKNTLGSPTSPTATAAAGFVAAAAGSSLRNQYLQKRRQLFKIGSRGSEPGCFTWPRGIAVGTDNSIVVADSSNHRVQVFDQNGIFVKEFGTYGNNEGEFDCLAGVAVNRIGQFIIADRYNHRIQVMDPAGRFLRAFGSQGTGDGRFNYPWGITTDALGFIYVCDKENHRVQVFQSDGTFVGKFGSHGNKPGQLEHPHYIAVSNTNRVIVSDSNNHRVQIFDVNGRVLSSFGSEGSEEGQFKFPSYNEEDTTVDQEETFVTQKKFDKFLKTLDPISYEDKVNHYLQLDLEKDKRKQKLLYDRFIFKENDNFFDRKVDRRRYSDVSLPIKHFSKMFRKKNKEKKNRKLRHQNSNIFETVPTSSYLYKTVLDSNRLQNTIKQENKLSKTLQSEQQNTKSSGLRKYHILNSGPDLSNILKPETLEILKEAKMNSGRPLSYDLSLIVSDVSSSAVAAPPSEGSSSRRSGLHLRGGLGKQSNTDLPSGRDVPTSVRLLGIGRRGVQGTGGSSSYEQRKYSGVRQGEPSYSSVLTNRPPLMSSTSVDNSLTYQKINEARNRVSTYRQMTPRSSSFTYRPRSTHF